MQTGTVRAIFGDSGHFIFDFEGRIELAIGSPTAVGQRVQAEWRAESNIWVMSGVSVSPLNAYPWAYLGLQFSAASDPPTFAANWLNLREATADPTGPSWVFGPYSDPPGAMPDGITFFNALLDDLNENLVQPVDLRWSNDGRYLLAMFIAPTSASNLFVAVWDFEGVARGQWGVLIEEANLTIAAINNTAPIFDSGHSLFAPIPNTFEQFAWSNTGSIYFLVKSDDATDTEPYITIVELTGVTSGSMGVRIVFEYYTTTDSPAHPYGFTYNMLSTGPILWEPDSGTLVIGHIGGNNSSGEIWLSHVFNSSGDLLGFCGNTYSDSASESIITKALAYWAQDGAQFMFVGVERDYSIPDPDPESSGAVIWAGNGSLFACPYVGTPDDYVFSYPENDFGPRGQIGTGAPEDAAVFESAPTTDRILIRGVKADGVTLQMIVGTRGDQPHLNTRLYYYMTEFNLATWQWGQRSNVTLADHAAQNLYWVDAEKTLAATAIGEVLYWDEENNLLRNTGYSPFVISPDGDANVRQSLAMPRPGMEPVRLVPPFVLG